MTVDTLERRETEIPPPNPPRANYAAWVIGAILVVLGTLWLLDVADVIALRAAVVLPVLLALTGVALIARAWDGPHGGLVLFGVFLTVAVVAAAVAPPNAFRGGIGERNYVVTQARELAGRYDVGMGDLRLDLRGLTLTEATAVDVTVGAGEMVILIPDDMAVSVDASVGAGEVEILDEVAEGVSVTKSYVSDGFEEAEVTLTLDLDVAAGSIEVTR